MTDKIEKLCNAIYRNNLPLIRDLLKEGINLNVITRDGQTPLMSAIYLKKNEIIELLLKHGADPDFCCNVSSDLPNVGLHVAAINGDLNVIKLLLEYQANINKETRDGNTALMLAIGTKQLEAMCLLIDKGANPDIKNNQGQSARTHILNFDEVARQIRSSNN